MTEELLNILTVVLALIFAISVLFWARKQIKETRKKRIEFKEKVDQLLSKIEDEKTKTNKHKDCKKCSVCINKEFE